MCRCVSSATANIGPNGVSIQSIANVCAARDLLGASPNVFEKASRKPLPDSKPEIRSLLEGLVPADRPGDPIYGREAGRPADALAPGAVVPAGLTFDTATGTVSVAAGTSAGNYSFDYQLCDIASPAACDIGTINVEVLAAPLVVRRAEDVSADRQEVTLFLHDFSFKSPVEVLAEITGGDGSMAGMDMGAATPAPDATTGMDMAGKGMSGMAMDLNDFNFDAYLANDRTLNDPEVVTVENGGRVRLRVINAAAATVFWIDTGSVEGRLVAVDGHEVQPLPGRRFGLAMGQRLDIELDLPNGEGAFPVLALREGAVERTGIILATAGATIEKLAGTGETMAAAFDTDLSQEAALRAMSPLSDRPADTAAMLMLGGSMQPYLWTINGQSWGNHTPITAKSGQRVELTFHNMSMMAHPMHLHGHMFQVVALNGKRFAGAMRDTVQVPPMAMVTVAVDAGEAARWMLHCHHMPHLSTGMMTEFAVSA